LPPTLRLIIAQRLVRRLCPVCKVTVENPREHLKTFNIPIPPDLEPRLWQARGCPDCRQQGYMGRIAVFEVLTIDEDFHPLLHGGQVDQIKKLAREKGMALLYEDGLRRAFAGDTSVEEVFRVAFAN
jgi:type II secretory ATPase GspE/PulE/Tfp pilus assembly ATPase PilB-like protein